ncbi:hypothetical protein GCM10010344_24850 [Streptomyces bluensis]|nr:hypothetical protein GCM10010344_24850 [Streptomyces bluensis]
MVGRRRGRGAEPGALHVVDRAVRRVREPGGDRGGDEGREQVAPGTARGSSAYGAFSGGSGVLRGVCGCSRPPGGAAPWHSPALLNGR